MKNMKKIIACLLISIMVLANFVGCGKKDTAQAPNGGTLIKFQYVATNYNADIFKELIETYNNTQGKIDGVAVSGIQKNQDYSDSCNTVLTSKNAPNVIVINDKFFKRYAEQDRFVCLDEYLEDDDLAGIGDNYLNRFRYQKDSELSKAGEGQPVYGLPLGDKTALMFYNIDYFEEQKIHIISVAEEDLDAYNAEHGTQYKPHGYAEYAYAPDSETEASNNLNGESVYKVFNNQIPTNWDELIYLSKYFSETYNPKSPTEYGYLTEWWFSFGWGVGGDCIGWNEEEGEYNFTLGDETPNYLATADVNINGNDYKAGEILTYGDKTALDGKVPADAEGKLYQLPSQLDAFIHYNSMTQDTKTEVMNGVYGLNINFPSLNDKLKAFTSGSIAMYNDYATSAFNITSASDINWDMAPTQQYRCYEGDADHDGVVKVIGKDGYTGDLLKQNGTEIVGELATQSLTWGMFVTKASDPKTYEASAKFVKWMAGEEAQKIYMKGNYAPIRTDLMTADATYHKVYDEKNIGAWRLMCSVAELGDWSYFDNGTWISNWSTPLNDDVRNGRMTLETFFEENQDVGDEDLVEKNIRIYGRLADE